METLRILFLGDVVGEPGRKAVIGQRGSVVRMMVPVLSVTITASEIPAQARLNF